MLLSSGEGEVQIMQGLRNFRDLVSDDGQLEFMLARRMFDEKLSTLSGMSERNQKECVAAIQGVVKIWDCKLQNLNLH
jgi:hypothetical protein